MTPADKSAVNGLIRSTMEKDWREAYAISSEVLGVSDDPDLVFQKACAGLCEEDADTLLELARDAAGDLITDHSDSGENEPRIFETGYTLFAIPIMLRPQASPTKDDFELLARCLQDATDGKTVVIVPEIVSPDAFLSATPDAIRHCVSVIDWMRTFDQELDPLEFIADRSEGRPDGAARRMLSVIVGARIEHFDGGTDYIPQNWANVQDDAMFSRFKFLLSDRGSVFAAAEWPMSAGRMMPGIRLRHKMEELVNEIATVAEDIGSLPDILLFEDAEQSFVSLSLAGMQIRDVVVDRRGTTIDNGDLAKMLGTFAPSVRETCDPKVYADRLRQGSALN